MGTKMRMPDHPWVPDEANRGAQVSPKTCTKTY